MKKDVASVFFLLTTLPLRYIFGHMISSNTKFEAKSTPDLDPLQVKIELLRRGTNLHRWAQDHGYEQSLVWMMLHRGHRGRRSRMIAKQLREELGV